MAIAVCSSSSHSLTLPTLSFSSLQAKTSFRTPLCPHPPTFLSSSRFVLVDDALTVSAAAEALACPMETDLGDRDSGHEVERDWRNGWSVVRRKRRRKRKKASEHSRIDENDGEDKQISFGPAKKSGHNFTPKEEAEYCRCLKEEVRVEAVRRRIEETSGHEPTSDQWIEATGMDSSTVDRILFDGKESQQRIIRIYRRLVVSIAACYQGKGLSLQDMIQEGSIGLLSGAKKFNPEMGYKLSTYAYWWIRQAITRAIAKKSRIIRLLPVMCREASVSCCQK